MTLGPQDTQQVGRYELITRIATGGMAEIFLARERGLAGLERMVVIKRILPHLLHQPSFVDMFLREARIIARLSHPNVVQIHELGEADGSYFIALEYIHGCTLRELQVLTHQAGQQFPFEVAVSIVIGGCRGAHAAHELTDLDGRPLGLVHRDISPHNLMVTPRGHVKLLDFGIAKSAEGVETTQSGHLKGKYAYMSPEQCLHQPLDRRSDVFALGIVLWELSAGRRLFYRQSELETLQAVIHGPAPGVRLVKPDFPEALDRVLRQALAPRPSERYPSAEAMRVALATAARALGYSQDPDVVAEFVSRVAGLSLDERVRVIDKAREQSLDSVDAMRLAHVLSESQLNAGFDLPTVADRPSPAALHALSQLSSEGLASIFPESQTGPGGAPSAPVAFDDLHHTAPSAGATPAVAEPGMLLDAEPTESSGSAGIISPAGAVERTPRPAGFGTDEHTGRSPSRGPLSSEASAVRSSVSRVHGPSQVLDVSQTRRLGLALALFGLVALIAAAAVWWQTRSPSSGATSEAPRLANSGGSADDEEGTLTGATIKFGFAPTVDRSVLVAELEPLRRYLQRATGRPVVFEISRDYGDLAERVSGGSLSFGMFPPLLYLRASEREPGLELVAIKQFDGATNSDGYLIVPHAAGVRTLADLQGKRFCFTDADSTSGYFLPRAYLRENGFDPDTFPGSIHWSGGHLQVMRDLIAGQCDAAATYNGAFLTADNYNIPTGRLRVFAITGHIPQDVVVASPATTHEERAALREALLTFAPRAAAGTERLGENQRITGFDPALPALFDELREVVSVDEGSGHGAP